jgi:hypothetical protein
MDFLIGVFGGFFIYFIYMNKDYFKYIWKYHINNRFPDETTDMMIHPSFCFDCDEHYNGCCNDCLALKSFKNDNDIDKAWELFISQKKYKVDKQI